MIWATIVSAIVWNVAEASAIVSAGIVRHDPFSRAGEVVRFSFERNEDRDFDGQPDDWIRRQGPSFPSYIRVEIDRNLSQDGRQSLRVDINCGPVVYYSPLKRVDALHAYVFEGYIRTQRLRHNAALFSLSFLNHRRQRIQRVLSRPVSGTHSHWVRLRIGPVVPPAGTRFVVIGCHVVEGKQKDLQGRVWFDNIRLGRIPQLSVVSNYQTHFKSPRSPVEIIAKTGGLDNNAHYQLRMELYDRHNQLVNATLRSLPLRDASSDPPSDSSSPETTSRPLLTVWKLPPQPRGYYRVRVSLLREGTVILEEYQSFIVMDFIHPDQRDVFGWTIQSHAEKVPLRDLVDIASQAGISWLKFPLWRSVADKKPVSAAEIARFFEILQNRRITPVGVLDAPPDEIRSKFSRDWSGVREIFTMPPKFWWPTVEPVVARFSSAVRYWQFGADTDYSLQKATELASHVRQWKSRFDSIGRDVRIGLPWKPQTPLPSRKKMPHTFFSLRDIHSAQSGKLTTLLEKTRASGSARWVTIQPLSKDADSAEQRGSDLVKRLTIAKARGAGVILASDVLQPHYGLLHTDGSPTELFLPWRTTVLALRGATFLGSLTLPRESVNYVFDRDGEGIVVLWNPVEVREDVDASPDVIVTDIWGRRLNRRPGKEPLSSLIPVGEIPVIVRGCSAEMLRCRLSTRFEQTRFQTRRGGQPQTLLVRNTFTQGINGKISLQPPPGWVAQPKSWTIRAAAGELLRLPLRITVPPNASQGTVPVTIHFQITADRHYEFRVYRSFQVVMGDVAIEVADRVLKDGRLEVIQTITNNTQPEEFLDFRCTLLAPGIRRQRRVVVKLGRGKDRKVYYLPEAEKLRGKTLWIRAEQIGGNRVLNFRWKALEEKSSRKNRKKKTVPSPPASSPEKAVPVETPSLPKNPASSSKQ